MYISYKKSRVLNEVILFGFLYFKDFSDLENLLLLNIEWNLILQLCLAGHLLKPRFLLDASILTTIGKEK